MKHTKRRCHSAGAGLGLEPNKHEVSMLDPRSTAPFLSLWWRWRHHFQRVNEQKERDGGQTNLFTECDSHWWPGTDRSTASSSPSHSNPTNVVDAYDDRDWHNWNRGLITITPSGLRHKCTVKNQRRRDGLEFPLVNTSNAIRSGKPQQSMHNYD